MAMISFPGPCGFFPLILCVSFPFSSQTNFFSLCILSLSRPTLELTCGVGLAPTSTTNLHGSSSRAHHKVVYSQCLSWILGHRWDVPPWDIHWLVIKEQRGHVKLFGLDPSAATNYQTEDCGQEMHWRPCLLQMVMSETMNYQGPSDYKSWGWDCSVLRAAMAAGVSNTVL